MANCTKNNKNVIENIQKYSKYIIILCATKRNVNYIKTSKPKRGSRIPPLKHNDKFLVHSGFYPQNNKRNNKRKNYDYYEKLWIKLLFNNSVLLIFSYLDN